MEHLNRCTKIHKTDRNPHTRNKITQMQFIQKILK